MPSKVRPEFKIPDHEVLRKIGGGAYGEVWLARGVTGAMRAVKVVWREDFEDERGFEREFEGILKFEPISRDHPGLVHILHVGRSPDGLFYYYVMQLGDDVVGGREINPVEYEARTLRGDQKNTVGVMWDTDECIEVGVRLAEALGHLHEQGLAHRDVKPSNVIFVNGKAKLADIGLVAARGQRTFVGTEGFVPPEGPGSEQADVYSLGKVLYEIATGKDRLNFPDLPDEIPTGGARKRWLELNRVICEVCEPRISKRKISTAQELAEALKRIQKNQSRRNHHVGVWFSCVILLGFSVWVGMMVVGESEWYRSWQVKRVEVSTGNPVQVGQLRVMSSPDGADVLDEDGYLVGTTNTVPLTARIGEKVVFTLRKEGYRSLTVEGEVTPDAVKEPMILFGQLQVFCPPVVGDAWVDHFGVNYQPDGLKHVSVDFVDQATWDQYLKVHEGKVAGKYEGLKVSENGEPVTVVMCDASVANAYAEWIRETGMKAGYLTEDHEVKAVIEQGFSGAEMTQTMKDGGLRPFRLAIRKVPRANMVVKTDPPGADVYLNGQIVGVAGGELQVPNLRPGKVELLLVLEGYKPFSQMVDLKEGETWQQELKLKKNQGVVFGKRWENGIKMEMVPVGMELMVSAFETRVSDYQLFVKEVGLPSPLVPTFDQEEDHPVVNVTREDAIAFCNWLTERERKEERIAPYHAYRLPTDKEWSLMVGLDDEVGISPNSRDAKKDKVFPWGLAWSEGVRYGNYADRTLGVFPGYTMERTINNYEDGFAFTAPVGSFPANQYGIYDLSGNVQEWVADDYSMVESSFTLGVLRGGGWNTYQFDGLYSGSRHASPPTTKDSAMGFRVVLAKVPLREE